MRRIKREIMAVHKSRFATIFIAIILSLSALI